MPKDERSGRGKQPTVSNFAEAHAIQVQRIFAFFHLFILLYGTLAYAAVDGAFIFYRGRCLHDYCAGTIVPSNRFFH
jgi:hypothetical protein